MKRTLLWYLWPFVRELYAQIESDQERWGDEWKNRPRFGEDLKDNQEYRIFKRYQEYYNEWLGEWMASNEQARMPWLKIAGLALIGWVREHYPNYKDI